LLLRNSTGLRTAFHSGALQYAHSAFADAATTSQNDAQILGQRIGMQVALQFLEVMAGMRRLSVPVHHGISCHARKPL
jgi:hypothetical protein